ncbi:hypothetical protein BCR44DRAFT_35512 [Catenaria anguillulae PL171]|uniref:Uncharacterized protein n=1 Tax=Catenaria anguillulae PL171 TaxID=765915 RepID=A0A1Y2HKP8_9FUNG|nr:hypothetical protein BCR44DRAFT_35512 [Catenaria anguillulae PL171]
MARERPNPTLLQGLAFVACRGERRACPSNRCALLCLSCCSSLVAGLLIRCCCVSINREVMGLWAGSMSVDKQEQKSDFVAGTVLSPDR